MHNGYISTCFQWEQTVFLKCKERQTFERKLTNRKRKSNESEKMREEIKAGSNIRNV